jgi:transcriptional regulator with XRE-family HTH domain
MDKNSDAHPLRAVFAHNIRKIRRLKEISQESLALDAGLSRTYLGEVERIERSVSIDIMGRIADTLGVQLKDLVDPDMLNNLKGITPLTPQPPSKITEVNLCCVRFFQSP